MSEPANAPPHVPGHADQVNNFVRTHTRYARILLEQAHASRQGESTVDFLARMPLEDIRLVMMAAILGLFGKLRQLRHLYTKHMKFQDRLVPRMLKLAETAQRMGSMTNDQVLEAQAFLTVFNAELDHHLLATGPLLERINMLGVIIKHLVYALGAFHGLQIWVPGRAPTILIAQAALSEMERRWSFLLNEDSSPRQQLEISTVWPRELVNQIQNCYNVGLESADNLRSFMNERQLREVGLKGFAPLPQQPHV